MKIRSVLAVVVAATIVFSPGWSGDEGARPATGDELAARVLAPTMDDGALRSIPTVKKNVQTGRSDDVGPSIWTTVVGSLSIAGGIALLWTFADSRPLSLQGRRLSWRPKRAPPHLRPA